MIQEKPIFFQKVAKLYKSRFEIASAYFKIVAIIDSLPITDRENEFLSYLSINGGNFSVDIRNSFVLEHGVSKAAVYNMISKLKGMNILVKKNKKICINKKVTPNLEQPSLHLELNLKVIEQPKEEQSADSQR